MALVPKTLPSSVMGGLGEPGQTCLRMYRGANLLVRL
jgi:hypothetical protein